MTPVEMARKCVEQIAIQDGSPDARVVLVMPGRPVGRSQRIRLAGRHGGPLGEVYCCNCDGNIVAGFSAWAVLRWLQRQHLVLLQAHREAAESAAGR